MRAFFCFLLNMFQLFACNLKMFVTYVASCVMLRVIWHICSALPLHVVLLMEMTSFHGIC